MDHTIKKYRLTSVGNNLELGKRGGIIKFDLANSRFQLYEQDKTRLSELEIADGTNGTSAVTLNQLNFIKESFISPYQVLTTQLTLTPNTKYYLVSNASLTLPSVSLVNIGDVIKIRSSNAIDSSSVIVFNETTDDILTNAGTTATFTIDTMGEFSFIYSGSSIWEVLWKKVDGLII